MKKLFLILFLVVTPCFAASTEDDCFQFMQEFCNACMENCPPKCVEIAKQNKAINLSENTMSMACKESCAKHCLINGLKQFPAQCKREFWKEAIIDDEG